MLLWGVALAPPNAASRCWKPHFRPLSNDLISEMAITVGGGVNAVFGDEASAGVIAQLSLGYNF
jgi:hypothetical protein